MYHTNFKGNSKNNTFNDNSIINTRLRRKALSTSSGRIHASLLCSMKYVVVFHSKYIRTVKYLQD